MSHADESFSRAPTHLTFEVAREASGKGALLAAAGAKLGMVGAADGAAEAAHVIALIVRGQGTIGFAVDKRAPFAIVFAGSDPDDSAFRWQVESDRLVLSERSRGEWRPLAAEEGDGLDPDPDCPYWFSLDSINRALICGKGEMRLGTKLIAHELPARPEKGADPYAWVAAIARAEVEAEIRKADVWRDPVTAEPPMRVVTPDEIRMEDVAHGEVTVPANLTPTCRLLYGNVAGASFELDTPDFPQFSAAIAQSIEDPDGWCRKVLEAKRHEFGDDDADMTYLRITLGRNQGESPGIPYVMEIWPAGHYSPVHNHGYSDAVIRVLHGKIWVDLYAMLSKHHLKPFATKTFEKGDVTWISARLNQVHKLHNDGSEPCITIQCYMYAENNDTHWPYFDYLEASGIGHFAPNSDADFLEFKRLMKAEWQRRHGLITVEPLPPQPAE